MALCRLSLLVVNGGYSSRGVWLLIAGASLVVECGLLIAVASLVAEHGLCSVQASIVLAPGLQSTGSVVVAHGLSCSLACGIFPNQGLDPCPLYWQTDSHPLHHQGSPISTFSYLIVFPFLGTAKSL